MEMREETTNDEGTKDTTEMNRYPSFVTTMRHDFLPAECI